MGSGRLFRRRRWIWSVPLLLVVGLGATWWAAESAAQRELGRAVNDLLGVVPDVAGDDGAGRFDAVLVALDARGDVAALLRLARRGELEARVGDPDSDLGPVFAAVEGATADPEDQRGWPVSSADDGSAYVVALLFAARARLRITARDEAGTSDDLRRLFALSRAMPPSGDFQSTRVGIARAGYRVLEAALPRFARARDAVATIDPDPCTGALPLHLASDTQWFAVSATASPDSLAERLLRPRRLQETAAIVRFQTQRVRALMRPFSEARALLQRIDAEERQRRAALPDWLGAGPPSRTGEELLREEARGDSELSVARYAAELLDAARDEGVSVREIANRLPPPVDAVSGEPFVLTFAGDELRIASVLPKQVSWTIDLSRR